MKDRVRIVWDKCMGWCVIVCDDVLELCKTFLGLRSFRPTELVLENSFENLVFLKLLKNYMFLES